VLHRSCGALVKAFLIYVKRGGERWEGGGRITHEYPDGAVVTTFVVVEGGEAEAVEGFGDGTEFVAGFSP